MLTILEITAQELRLWQQRKSKHLYSQAPSTKIVTLARAEGSEPKLHVNISRSKIGTRMSLSG